MEKKIIFIAFIFSIAINKNGFTQTKNSPIETFSLWKIQNKQAIKGFGKYCVVDINKTAIKDLLTKSRNEIVVEIENEGIKYQLDLQENVMENVKVKINNNEYLKNVSFPKMYAGKIRGESKANNCMITIAENYISAQIHFPNYLINVQHNISKSTDEYVQTDSREVEIHPLESFNCGTKDDDKSVKQNNNEIIFNRNTNNTLSPLDRCSYVFVDCTQAFYNHFNLENNSVTIQNSINHVYSIWNDVSRAFLNEQLNVQISEINIWTTTIPFTTSTRELGIQTFAGYYQNNFQGNMAMLLDWNAAPRFGVAGAIGAAKANSPNVCGNYSANPNPIWRHGSYIYNDLNYFGSYQNFPTPAIADEVYVCVHELGHLFGSPHTHWCGWAGGPIDLCGPLENGPCAGNPTTPPTAGGTFMSYCIRFATQTEAATGPMNFNNGFGPQPGNVIRNFVLNNACITNCNCLANQNIGTITTPGFYHFEAAQIVTASGTVPSSNSFIKLDGGVKVRLAPGFKAYQGARVNVYIDGCEGIR